MVQTQLILSFKINKAAKVGWHVLVLLTTTLHQARQADEFWEDQLAAGRCRKKVEK